MNTKQDQINDDIKSAMKAKDVVSLSVLRMLKTALSNAALIKGSISEDMSDNEVVSIVKKQIKQREDSAKQFRDANRIELAKKEESEISVLSKYLPKELTESELDSLIQQTITEQQATSKKDTSRVLKRMVEITNNAIDTKMASQKLLKILV